MKKQIELLRLSARQAEKDELKKEQEEKGMIFPEIAIKIHSFFEGYKQALDDLEQALEIDLEIGENDDD